MMFRILALTGEKIEKAVDFQSREHETQVSEYLHGSITIYLIFFFYIVFNF